MLDFDHTRLRLTAALLKGKVPQDTPLMHECWILTTPVSDSLGFLYHLTQSQAQTHTYTGTHTDTHTHTPTHTDTRIHSPNTRAHTKLVNPSKTRPKNTRCIS